MLKKMGRQYLTLTPKYRFAVLGIRGLLIVSKIRYPRIFSQVIRRFCPFFNGKMDNKMPKQLFFVIRSFGIQRYSENITHENNEGSLQLFTETFR